ncbi:MAG TPA: response regulator, partial [Methylomirabilota bacterium]|nr:response regulator [Methylomirabilota bacterium]
MSRVAGGAPAPPGRPAAGPGGPRRRPVVLVVDDEEGIRASLTTVLEDACDVVTASSGGAALEVLHARPVDVVLLDLHLPGLSGLQVLQRVKAQAPRVEVIVVTVVVDVPIVVDAMRLGAFHFLGKPWDDDELRLLVERAARRHRGEVGGVLLVGGDVARLATLRVLLERHVEAETLPPEAAAFLALRREDAWLVVLDSAGGGDETAAVKVLEARYPRARWLRLAAAAPAPGP